MSDFPMPIANIGRRKRLFNPDRNAGDDGQALSSDTFLGSDDSNDTFMMNDEVGTESKPAYQIPDIENQAAGDYESSLAQMPNREDYKPSFGRSLVSGLVGGLSAFAGNSTEHSIGIAKGLQDEKYNEAMGEWGKRNQQLKALSDISYKNIGARSHAAQIRNKFISDIAATEFKRDKEEYTRHNDDLNRQQRGKQLDEQSRHDLATEGQTAINQTEANKIHNRQVDAYIARSNKIGSRGSQVSHSISPASQQKAHDESVKEILMEQPDFEQYFDIDPKTNKIIGLRRNEAGQIAKLAPKGSMFGGSDLVPQSLTDIDKLALRNFQTKLTEKIKKKLSLNMGNVQEMEPNQFEFQDVGPDQSNPVEQMNDFSGYDK